MSSVAPLIPHEYPERCPPQLANVRGWLVWRRIRKAGEPGTRKVPLWASGQTRVGTQGSALDRANLVTFDEALAAAKAGGYDGVGFATLAEFGVVIVDFDDVDAATIAHLTAGTYTERSPSKQGIHAIYLGALRNRKSHKAGDLPYGFETFHHNGFVTFTGDMVEGSTLEVIPLPAAVLAVYAERFPVAGRPGDGKPEGYSPDEARAMLAELDPDMGYDGWLRVGMALQHEFGEEGFEIWDTWSAGGGKYAEAGDLEGKWRSFGHHVGAGVTIGTLKKMARAAGATVGTPVARVDEFEVLADEPAGEEDPLPRFDRDKSGQIKATLRNVRVALVDRRLVGGLTVALDRFKGDIMIGPGGHDGWRRLIDDDYVVLREALETRGFKPIGREMMRDVVGRVARDQAFDSAITWLLHIVPAWDGVPRIDRFLVDYAGAEDSAYIQGVSTYLWTAMSGRVLEPGVKADMAIVLLGFQGVGKSRLARALAPAEAYYGEVSFHNNEADTARAMKGKIVCEMGELRGLRSRDEETIKAWLVRQVDQWVPKYKEMAEEYPRRCVVIGTTNEEDFLADATGNRRWLPVRVGAIDVAGAREVVLQCWAEARDRFLVEGVEYNVERIAGDIQEDHRAEDPLVAKVEEWLATPRGIEEELPLAKGYVTSVEIIDDLRLPLQRGEEMRMARALRACGLRKVRVMIEGRRRYQFTR